MGFGTADRMTCRRLVLPLPDRISRWEDAVIYRAGFSHQADSLALGPWHKSNYFAHIRSDPLENESILDDGNHSMRMWDLRCNFEAMLAVTKE
jgi:hypothetical protein